jgi:predicted DNA-binding transcriptional regulator YafY
MGAPLTRELSRCNALLRQWRVLVAVRRGGRTVQALAEYLGCTQRTVYRDLRVLQRAGFPLYTVGHHPTYWRLHPFSGWPAGEIAPILEPSECADPE